MFLYIIILLLTSHIYASETPIIGVLSQENYLVKNAYPDADSFIVASYIKILEASGARAIPIWYEMKQLVFLIHFSFLGLVKPRSIMKE